MPITAKIGMTVRLKSGGPHMTVLRLVQGSVRCAWFDNNDLRWDEFPEECLVRVNDICS